MARGNKSSEGRSARSEAFGNLPVGRYDATQGLKNLFPASRIPAADKPAAEKEALSAILKKTDEYAGETRKSWQAYYDTYQIEKEQGKYAEVLAKGMVNGDKSNGLEDYFPKGMSTGFINALAKSGYSPGPNDPATQDALARLIDARVSQELLIKGGRDGIRFGGNWGVRAVKDPDGFRLEAYTEDYTGRDSYGEKTYDSSDTVEIAFIPHDEVSSKKFLTSPEEIYNSNSFIKAQALKGYLDALLMTSDF